MDERIYQSGIEALYRVQDAVGAASDRVRRERADQSPDLREHLDHHLGDLERRLSEVLGAVSVAANCVRLASPRRCGRSETAGGRGDRGVRRRPSASSARRHDGGPGA